MSEMVKQKYFTRVNKPLLKLHISLNEFTLYPHFVTGNNVMHISLSSTHHRVMHYHVAKFHLDDLNTLEEFETQHFNNRPTTHLLTPVYPL